MRFIYLAIIAFTFASCNQPETSNPTTSQKDTTDQLSGLLEYSDPHSFAKADQAVVTHLDWNAEVDFENKVIRAKASWKIEQDWNEIHFDVKNLVIEKITIGEKEKEVEYTLSEEVEFLGQDLTIPLEKNTEWVHIYYHTTDGADALQFLDPMQTAGKKHQWVPT